MPACLVCERACRLGAFSLYGRRWARLAGGIHARGVGFFEGTVVSECHGDDFRLRGHVCFEGTFVCEPWGPNLPARGRAAGRPFLARNASLRPSVIRGAK